MIGHMLRLPSRARFSGVVGGAMLCGLASAVVLAQPGPATGNAERGRTLFNETYKCYACHGFDAQTGQRRLVPINYTQEGFVTFVQNSPLPQMPVYADVSDQDLADVYAYIRTIAVDAPEIDDIPLLKGILDETREALAD